MAFSINESQHDNTLYRIPLCRVPLFIHGYAECHYAQFKMLNFIIWSVIMLNVIMLSVIMLNAVGLTLLIWNTQKLSNYEGKHYQIMKQSIIKLWSKALFFIIKIGFRVGIAYNLECHILFIVGKRVKIALRRICCKALS